MSWGRCICGERLGAGKTFGDTMSAGQRSGTAVQEKGSGGWWGQGLAGRGG